MIKQYIQRRLKNFVVDMLYDETTGRGGEYDSTTRLTGQRGIRSSVQYRTLYSSNGFIQNIIEQPAEDATREWIDVETNRDEDLKINRLILNRMDDLGLQRKIKDLIKFYRMFPKGSMLFYGVIADKPVTDEILKTPIMLETVQEIDFINVLENPDHFHFRIENQTDPTKADFNKPSFMLMGKPVDSSRVSWMCNNFDPTLLMGISIIDVIFDAISAQDSALWSVSSMVQDMATKIFKSDIIRSMKKSKITELLLKLKNDMNTASAVAIGNDEDYQKLIHGVTTGMGEVFEFIFDNLGGVSRMPRNTLLGKAHGVVTQGEYDTLNYYANIAKFQENDVRAVIKKNIDLIIHEQRGEIYKALGGKVESLDVEFTFKSLWKLDPVSQADSDLKNSQRDQIDIDCGKCNQIEARSLDPRMDNLEDFREIPEITPEQAAIKNPDVPVIEKAPGVDPRTGKEFNIPETKPAE